MRVAASRALAPRGPAMLGVYGLFQCPLKSGLPFGRRGVGPAGGSVAPRCPPRPPPRCPGCPCPGCPACRAANPRFNDKKAPKAAIARIEFQRILTFNLLSLKLREAILDGPSCQADVSCGGRDCSGGLWGVKRMSKRFGAAYSPPCITARRGMTPDSNLFIAPMTPATLLRHLPKRQ